MKIAMLVRGLDYGYGGHVTPLVTELRKLDVNVKIIIAMGDLRAAAYFLNHKLDVDLVHCQGSYSCPIKIKVPKVTTVHTLLGDELRYDWALKPWLGQLFETRTLRTSNAIISVNPTLNHRIHMICPNVETHTISNGVNVDEFNNSTQERGRFLLAGGRFIRRKGLKTLTTALRDTDLPSLQLFGGGPLKDSISWTLRPQDNMLGFIQRKDLVALYKTATAFICPSLYETGPITVLEAMAAHCPVVCADIPGIWATVQNEETGLLYPPNKIDKLVHQIRRLTEDAELRHRLAENAYSYVCQHRRWEDAAKETIKVYEEVIAN